MASGSDVARHDVSQGVLVFDQQDLHEIRLGFGASGRGEREMPRCQDYVSAAGRDVSDMSGAGAYGAFAKNAPLTWVPKGDTGSHLLAPVMPPRYS